MEKKINHAQVHILYDECDHCVHLNYTKNFNKQKAYVFLGHMKNRKIIIRLEIGREGKYISHIKNRQNLNFMKQDVFDSTI